MNRSLSVLVISVALAAGACGEDGGTSPQLPAAATATTATSQSARMGDTVPAAPAVRVTDQQGNPMAGVPVQFFAGGGGVIATPQTATAADGTASAAQWTLGTVPGLNTVTARVPGLPPVTFTANPLDPCAVSTVHTIGDTARGELDALDCRAATGQRTDYYAMAVAAPGYVVVELKHGGEPSLSLINGEGQVIAQGGPRIHVLALPTGTYFVAAGGTWGGPAAPRPYTLAAHAQTETVGCVPPWIVPGVSIAQQLTANDDCRPGYMIDQFAVQLATGQSITVEMQSSSFDTQLSLADTGGTTLVLDRGEGGGLNSQVRYTANLHGRYIISASRRCLQDCGAGDSGPYVLTVR